MVALAAHASGTAVAIEVKIASERWLFADIVCEGGAAPRIHTKAWGIEYQPNIDVNVVREVYINNEPWRTEERILRTSGTGSWSTPTDTYFTVLRGEYDLAVHVYNHNDGRWLGTSRDTCRLL